MRLSRFGSFIQNYRTQKGITRQSMSNTLQVSEDYLGSLETQNKAVPLELERKLSERYVFTPEESEQLLKAVGNSWHDYSWDYSEWEDCFENDDYDWD